MEGQGKNEIGKRADNGDIVIKLTHDILTSEVDKLLGDATKAKLELGWAPKISLEELVSEMISHDNNEAKKELILKNRGFPLDNPLETINEVMNK